ncbi:STAS domain-containing protein [Streptomyces sp. NPDC050256]|uniref:STAS domain-containing protein n=1 Tax=Streptomyces sp. NPDC050256 TaxID=3365607 RepID=UPI0037A2C671
MNQRHAYLAKAAAWLALTAVSVWAGAALHSDAAQLLCLLSAATGLRMMLVTARSLLYLHRGIDVSAPAVVRLRGEITARNGQRFGRRITSALTSTPSQLQVDMRQVSLLTTEGTQALFTAVRNARHRETSVVVIGANAQVRSTLHRVGLDHFLTYTDKTGT